jgi:epoxyqueuosine reductase QueG
MDKQTLLQRAGDFCDNSPTNYLPDSASLSEDAARGNNFARNNIYGNASDALRLGADSESDYVGMRFYKKPLLSVGAAADPLFRDIQKPEAVGPFHKLPADWIPDAKSVISLFVPFEDRILASNKSDPVEPSLEWLMARVDGQKHLLALGAFIRDAITGEGYEAVCPQLEDEYAMRPAHFPLPDRDDIPPYASNWSERHVGVVTGLGTFGLSTNFISKAGCAGRLISIVTNKELSPDERDYDSYLGYCNKCRACMRKCPAAAYISDGKKDHRLCGEHIHKTCMKYEPRYGCGKCQSGIPCERQPLVTAKD